MLPPRWQAATDKRANGMPGALVRKGFDFQATVDEKRRVPNLFGWIIRGTEDQNVSGNQP